ncbi:MAG: AAA family ATPase [Proteobacteria bacterium]|nr:AAA family ATPase [Pseudomonadota bacterium]
MTSEMRIVAFAAGKGGCGKTTLAINFASQICQSGSRVLVFDFDLYNQGATGNFSQFFCADDNQYGTTHDLLAGALEKPPVEIKENMLFVPAQRPGESSVIPFDLSTVRERVEQFANDIRSYAEKYDVNLVVLDCFCGIDALTTASIGCADDAILVNEPDLITYTGTLNLLYHIKSVYREWAHAPRIHFVVNRMRPPDTVKSLTYLYRDNLASEVDESILCHFPYSERVARTFGHCTLITDLLPRSLFTQKLQLLAYILFKDLSPELIPAPVRSLSPRKFKKLYFASVDPAAVDAETLVLRLTRFPLFFSAWLILVILSVEGEASPEFIQRMYLILGASGVLVFYPLVKGFWSAARFNFSLAQFRFRLSMLRQLSSEKWTDRFLGARELFIGAMMVFFLVSSVAIIMSLLYDNQTQQTTFTGDQFENLKSQEKARTYEFSIGSKARLLDLKNQTVEGGYALKWDNSRVLVKSANEIDLLSRGAIINDTTFTKVLFSAEVLNGRDLEKVRFVDSIFTVGGKATDELKIDHIVLEKATIDNPMIAPGTPFHKVSFSGNSTLQDTKFKLEPGTTLDLTETNINGTISVTNRKAPTNEEVDFQASVTVKVDSFNKDFIKNGKGVTIAVAKDDSFQMCSSRIEFTKKIIQLVDKRGTIKSIVTKGSLRERANLAEYYLLRGTDQDIVNADIVLRELASLNFKYAGQKKAKNPSARVKPNVFEGYQLLLQLLYQIQTNGKEIDNAAVMWSQWLSRNPLNKTEKQEKSDCEQVIPWAWSWGSWNEAISKKIFTNKQKFLFKLAEQSTSGELRSTKFLAEFQENQGADLL